MFIDNDNTKNIKSDNQDAPGVVDKSQIDGYQRSQVRFRINHVCKDELWIRCRVEYTTQSSTLVVFRYSGCLNLL